MAGGLGGVHTSGRGHRPSDEMAGTDHWDMGRILPSVYVLSRKKTKKEEAKAEERLSASAPSPPVGAQPSRYHLSSSRSDFTCLCSVYDAGSPEQSLSDAVSNLKTEWGNWNSMKIKSDPCPGALDSTLLNVGYELN